jgi:hypothetical protein
MNDGEMGSLRICEDETPSAGRQFGSKVSEINFVDSDGIPVTAALLLDDDGKLFELDVFKADFSPLLAIPRTPGSPPSTPRG